MAQTIEVEVDTPANANLFFLPANRTIRGRFDFARDAEPMAKVLTQEFPRGVPGQRLVLDLDAGEAHLVESLHFPEHKDVRKAVEKRWGIGPERETFKVPPEDAPTWLYWLKRAVDAGTARLLSGTLPDKVEGKVKKTVISLPQRRDPKDELIQKLTAILYASLPESKRAQVEALLSDSAE
jgi:hypothetical protein